ncbi:MAG: aminopeptidase P family protein [Desulfamplus sp.]|nr:aminopeptidase P family protein [Desulfamplus sp.]
MSLDNRIKRLKNLIKKNNFDAVTIFSDENRRYLSGFTAQDGNYDESSGFLVITQNDLILATDSRYKLQAQNEAELYSIYCYEKGLAVELPDILKSLSEKPGTVAVEASRITFELYNKIREKIGDKELEVELVSAEDALKYFRIIKDNEEIEAIKASLKIAENAFLQLKPHIHSGMTEREAAWLLERLIRENGADSLSFPVIAASGPNCALPHAIPSDRRFQKHEPLLFDFGAKLNGYCSDISRTLVIGEADAMFKDVYETLFNAQKMAIEAVRPGIKCSDIDKIARYYIDNSKFKGRFGHALGHGVGIAIHEPPRLSRLDDTPLQAGMVVTVEPGIYIPEWGGIRLENMVRVTESGAEVLNTIGYEDYIV